MSIKRTDRINELLQREIASGLYQVQTTPPLDLARVTVASVACSPDLRKAKVMVSVLEDEKGETRAENVIRALNRHRKDLQAMIASNIVLKYTPHLQFVLDEGQARADRIYRILDSLPPPAEEATDAVRDVPARKPDDKDSADGAPKT